MGSRSDDDYWNNKYAEVDEGELEDYDEFDNPEDQEAFITMMEIIGG